MSALGHSLPIHSVPAPTNVRYAFDSDQILRCSERSYPEGGSIVSI